MIGILISQSSKQFNGNRYSYSLYDNLGRVIEAGEKTENTTSATKFNSIFGTTIANYFNPKVIDDLKLNNWIADNTGARKEVTKSYYDETVITGLPVNFTPNQQNLRKRIVHVTYEDIFDGNDQTYDHGSHYDYDVHGSVKTVIQDNQKLANTFSIDPNIVAQRFKRLDYNYDLISGNVHKVEYQNRQADEWNHRYEYDADNRITQVETSTNEIFWDKDAQYKYYSHGALARTEIGDNQVQGCDYVYTLQGWIKGVNSNTLNENNDPGKDGTSAGSIPGNPNEKFARDVYGYSLGYFSGDYQSIEASNQGTNSFIASIAGSDVEANRNDLFNGNIGSMITTITNPVTRDILPLGNAYKYDQLNRLLQAVSYNNLDLNTGNTSFNSFGTGVAQMYFNAFTYDANGNIQTQSRKDHLNNSIDNLQYRYAEDANGKIIQNRLYHVNEDPLIADNTFSDDIDDQGVFDPTLLTINSNNNYSFDEIGNLARDDKEGIEEIKWRVDGKISEINMSVTSGKPDLKFDYDVFGRRIAKHLFDQNNVLLSTEYYVNDPQGGVIGVYKYSFDNNTQQASYLLTELDIYGVNKMGVLKPKIELVGTIQTDNIFKRELREKNYFYSNHLMNIITTTSDLKIPIDDNSNNETDYYVVEIISAVDYSPFGVELYERKFSSSKTDYGLNNQRKDNEVYGDGNSYTAEFWQYDPRLGRRWNIDPIDQIYNSNYSCFYNSPIMSNDLKGDKVNVGAKKQKREDNYEKETGKKKTESYIITKGGSGRVDALTDDYQKYKNELDAYNKGVDDANNAIDKTVENIQKSAPNLTIGYDEKTGDLTVGDVSDQSKLSEYEQELYNAVKSDKTLNLSQNSSSIVGEVTKIKRKEYSVTANLNKMFGGDDKLMSDLGRAFLGGALREFNLEDKQEGLDFQIRAFHNIYEMGFNYLPSDQAATTAVMRFTIGYSYFRKVSAGYVTYESNGMTVFKIYLTTGNAQRFLPQVNANDRTNNPVDVKIK